MKVSNLIRRISQASQEIIGDTSSESELLFIHSILGLCCLPYKSLPLETTTYRRDIGKMSLLVQSGSIFDPHKNKWVNQSIPIGKKPRILSIALCSEAIKKGNPIIKASPSMTSYIKKLGFHPTSATISSFKKALMSLVACRFQLGFIDADMPNVINTHFISKCETYFPSNKDQLSLWDSEIVLSSDFYDSLTLHAIPLDARIVRALQHNARALDIYVWLNYRLRYLKKPSRVGYNALKNQFSTQTTNSDTFKRQFNLALKEVLAVYHAARVDSIWGGLLLYPSRSSVRKISNP